MRSIRIAQANALRGDASYVETDTDILQFMFPTGLGDAGYGVLEGIKVFPRGRAEEILAYEAESPTDRERRQVQEREAKQRAEQAKMGANGTPAA